MIAALQELQSRSSVAARGTESSSTVKTALSANAEKFVVEVIDIDLHPEWELGYGDKVPVLLAQGRPRAGDDSVNNNDEQEQTEICHYFFDQTKLVAYFDGR